VFFLSPYLSLPLWPTAMAASLLCLAHGLIRYPFSSSRSAKSSPEGKDALELGERIVTEDRDPAETDADIGETHAHIVRIPQASDFLSTLDQSALGLKPVAHHGQEEECKVDSNLASLVSVDLDGRAANAIAHAARNTKPKRPTRTKKSRHGGFHKVRMSSVVESQPATIKMDIDDEADFVVVVSGMDVVNAKDMDDKSSTTSASIVSDRTPAALAARGEFKSPALAHASPVSCSRSPSRSPAPRVESKENDAAANDKETNHAVALKVKVEDAKETNTDASSSLPVTPCKLQPEPREKELTVLTGLKAVPWRLAPFLIGMFIIIEGMAQNGFTTALAHAIAPRHGGAMRSIWTGFTIASLGANFITNQPMGILLSKAIEDPVFLNSDDSCGGSGKLAGVIASIAGTNLAANLTVVGALAGVLFCRVAAARGVEIGKKEFSYVGLCVMPFVLIATAVVLTMQAMVTCPSGATSHS